MSNGKWKHARSRGSYLFNTDQVASVFRARLVSNIRELIATKQIEGRLPNGLFDKKWVMYAKQPFGGAGRVVKYLGRYTHRTAISNDRILKVTPETVTFTWKDYAENYRRKTTSIDGDKFLGMFCQHILPSGFTRIRHYGFLSSAAKGKSLATIRSALETKPRPVNTAQTWQELVLSRMGIQTGICKCCQGKIRLIQVLPDQFEKPTRAPPFPMQNVTSCNTET